MGVKQFLSTPSARRATAESAERETAGEFLSTPSARRATITTPLICLLILVFLSTPSARRATTDLQEVIRALVKFLSTPSARRATAAVLVAAPHPGISIHALREEGDGRFQAALHLHFDFYPRPPRGGRPTRWRQSWRR